MKSSYVQSTKKNKMLVLGDRVFHVNKTVPTNHLGKPNCTKVYWRCITKNCGGSAYTVSTEEGEEIEVRLSRDHDPVLCAEDKHIPLTIERRREVKNLARAVLCLYRYFLNISCQVIDKVAEGTPLEVAYNEGEYSSSSRSFILIKRCTVYCSKFFDDGINGRFFRILSAKSSLCLRACRQKSDCESNDSTASYCCETWRLCHYE